MKSVIMMLVTTSMGFGNVRSQESNMFNGGQFHSAPINSTIINFRGIPTATPLLPSATSNSNTVDEPVIATFDHPAVVFAAMVFLSASGTASVAAATYVIVNDIYDATTDQQSETTTVETNNDGQSSESKETTSDTDSETETESESQMSGPETPKYFNIGGTLVKNVFSNKTMIQTINQTQDEADILLTDKNIKSVYYRVERTIKTKLKRKNSFPKDGVKLQLNLEFDQLSVSTKDIPKTDGSSSITIIVSGNGKTLYTFKASVDQGKAPSFSDWEANKYVVKGEKGLLIIKGLQKRIEFNAEPGRSTDEFVVRILTEGIGKRI